MRVLIVAVITFALFLAAWGLGLATMIYGWGLQVQSWPAVIGFPILAALVTSLAQAIGTYRA